VLQVLHELQIGGTRMTLCHTGSGVLVKSKIHPQGEALMRKLIGAFGAIALSATSASAADGPWCFRDLATQTYRNCFFYSLRECLAASVMGGACERNPWPASRSGSRKSTAAGP
jgi:hypothetical protein